MIKGKIQRCKISEVRAERHIHSQGAGATNHASLMRLSLTLDLFLPAPLTKRAALKNAENVTERKGQCNSQEGRTPGLCRTLDAKFEEPSGGLLWLYTLPGDCIFSGVGAVISPSTISSEQTPPGSSYEMLPSAARLKLSAVAYDLLLADWLSQASSLPMGSDALPSVCSREQQSIDF